MNDYFEKLIELSQKASEIGEVPVAALIVINNKIIATSYNSRHDDGNPLNHAEVKCIIKASEVLKDWRLNECDLYVTLEPCDMCKRIIEESRIKKVYYMVPSTKKVCRKTSYQQINSVFNAKYINLLKSFFKNKR